jgi:predicted Rossmann-fold nucleotide-binding protein
MRVLVCGGRNYVDRDAVYRELDATAAKHGWLTIIEGGAAGADRLGRKWAKLHFHGVVTVEADWPTYGKAAGPIRNARMLSEAKPDLVLAFPGGVGTMDMVRQAREAGVKAEWVFGFIGEGVL